MGLGHGHTQAVIVQAFDPCCLEGGVWSVAIAMGQQSLGGCELTRIGRSLTGLIAGICPTYCVARRAEVAERSPWVCVVRPLGESGRCRGKRGSHHHCRDPSWHWLFHRVYNHVDFFRQPRATSPSHSQPRKRSRLKLAGSRIETEGLGSGERQRILELYDLPATLLIDDLEARKLPILFLDVELARLVYHMV